MSMIKLNMSFRFSLNKLKSTLSKELSDPAALKSLQDVSNTDDREPANTSEEEVKRRWSLMCNYKLWQNSLI